jgi:hypothetical protein
MASSTHSGGVSGDVDMEIDCNKLPLVNGEFGPNKIGHKYRPMSYHGVKAKKSKDKSRWNHPVYAEYHVFNLADEHDGNIGSDGIIDRRWVDDDGKGLYSLVDDCKVILGKDNEERFAYFRKPINTSDPWHGYPVDGLEIGEELIEYWYKKKIITESTYLRLSRHQLI